MAWIEIYSYFAEWDCTKSKGKIGVKDHEGEWHWKFVEKEEDFKDFTNNLKKEGGMYINDRVGHLGQIIRTKPKDILLDLA